jgi:hypothetical protein
MKKVTRDHLIVTDFVEKEEIIHTTQFGPISGLVWLRRERERLMNQGVLSFIENHRNGTHQRLTKDPEAAS